MRNRNRDYKPRHFFILDGIASVFESMGTALTGFAAPRRSYNVPKSTIKEAWKRTGDHLQQALDTVKDPFHSPKP